MCNKPDIGDHHARSVCEQGLHRYVTHFQEGKEAQLRVNVDGDFGQTVFVRYPGYAKVRVLEGDEIVAVVDGRVTYTAVLGN
jgi:hypothetical protein